MAIVEKFCRRFEEPDSDAFADLFAGDATYIDSLYGAYEGREAILSFHRKCHEEAGGYQFRPVNIIVSDDGRAAFEWRFSYTSRMPRAKGKRVDLKGASFMTLRDGKIVSYREYTDSIVMLLRGNVPDEKLLGFYRRKYPFPDSPDL